MSTANEPQQASAQPPQMPYRYDGIAKVTGKATYASEFRQPFERKNLAYAYMVTSTIACGTITTMDRSVAEKAPGVLAVLTPFNAPRVTSGSKRIFLLQDTAVAYSGQPIAVVVARSLLQAQAAAALLKITYKEQTPKLDFLGRLKEARPPKDSGNQSPVEARGDVQAAFARSAVTVDEVYVTPMQFHNPMEPHATVAWWEGEKLNVYDSTQSISGVTSALARVFGIPAESVHLQCPYTGGGFGSKGGMWSQVPLCAMAAKVVGQPVQLAMERPQMFGPVGGRTTTVNRIKLGAQADGKLLGVEHDAVMQTSTLEDFVEGVVKPTRMLYNSEANSTSMRMVEVNTGVSNYQRAPGEAPGTAVIEMAMDELAHKLGMDPVKLRLMNYAENDPSGGRPWGSKHLRECYAQAAARFGWDKRSMEPGTKVEGNQLIGYGMATATYPANRSTAQAVVRALPNGRVFVGSGTQDMGTGTYSIMAQTVAHALQMDPMGVDVKLGDSTLPKAPGSGGSASAASVCPAIDDACRQLKAKLVAMAVGDAASPLHGAMANDVELKDGVLRAGSKSDAVTALLARAGGQAVETNGTGQPAEHRGQFSSHSFGAVFAEVAVDKDTHMVQVRRVVATYDIGTLINNKTGMNQLQGGIVWGVSFALHEEAVLDPVYGRIVNGDLASYHVPVNADIQSIDVTVLGIPDTRFSPLGARGIGEIGITGAMAAVANAVFNATGKRVREYPITPDKITMA